MGTLEDLKAAVFKNNATQLRGGVNYDFKNHTALYEFKTVKGAENAVNEVLAKGGSVKKTVLPDGSIAFKAFDATNNTAYTLLFKRDLVKSEKSKKLVEQAQSFKDIAIDYVPPVDAKTGKLNFSEIDKAQVEPTAKEDLQIKTDSTANVTTDTFQATTAEADSTIVNNEFKATIPTDSIPTDSTKIVNNQNVEDENEEVFEEPKGNFIDKFSDKIGEKLFGLQFIGLGVLVANKIFKPNTRYLKLFGVATAKLSQRISAVTDPISGPIINRVVNAFFTKGKSLLEIPSVISSSFNSAKAAVKSQGFFKATVNGIWNWGKNHAVKAEQEAAAILASKMPKLASFVSGIGLGSIANIAKVKAIAGPAAMIGLATEALAGPIGSLVGMVTGSKTADDTTTGALKGAGAAAGLAGTGIWALAAAGMAVPGPGWIIAACAVAYGAYKGYQAYQESKAEQARVASQSLPTV